GHSSRSGSRFEASEMHQHERRSAMTVTAHSALVLAVHAVFSERVSGVAEYDTWARSPSTRLRLPSVVALRKYQPSARRVAFTRRADGWDLLGRGNGLTHV